MDKWSIEQSGGEIAARIDRIRSEIAEAAIAAGRDPKEVRLMAVTKTVDAERINQAIACGVDLIGENKVQEYLGKRDALRLDGVETHLIGHLQTNKVRQIVGKVDLIQSVDSLKLAREIGKVSEKAGLTTDVLLEVNIGKEENKSGFFREELEEAVAAIAEIGGVRVRGLMTIPPQCEKEVETARFFSNMRQLFLDISGKKMDNISMEILSMGMSGDFPLAVRHGATMVRVGSAIFGARHYT